MLLASVQIESYCAQTGVCPLVRPQAFAMRAHKHIKLWTLRRNGCPGTQDTNVVRELNEEAKPHSKSYQTRGQIGERGAAAAGEGGGDDEDDDDYDEET